MTMVCDKCGETFEYPEFSISERTQKVENNSICRCITKKNRKIFIYSDDPFFLCPSCMAKLNDWLTPNEQKPDTGNKNEWNSMNVQPQCGEAVEIKFENGDLDLAYRKYADKRWFQSSGEWVASDSKIVAWRYLY